jgi:hypothetical protein
MSTGRGNENVGFYNLSKRRRDEETKTRQREVVASHVIWENTHQAHSSHLQVTLLCYCKV